MRYEVDTYDNSVEILAGVNGLRSPVHVLLDASKVSPDAEGRKFFEPGFWVAKSGDMGRPLPRAKPTTAVTTSSTTVVVDAAQAFIPGDTLYVIPASAHIALAATWAAADTLAITVAGITYTYTATGSVLATIATAAAAGFNADPRLKDVATAIASGTTITIVAKDYRTPHSISVTATTAGDGTATVAGSQSALIGYRTIGTIDASGVNVATKTLTLTSTAAVAVAVGVPIGTADPVLGMHLRSLDLNEQALEVGVYTSLSGKAGAFPYWDAGLAAQFPEIQAVNK
jgi:hypothetical protein